MVVLKLVVLLILERDYARLSERAQGRKFLEIVKEPENTLVGQFVNHFKNRYARDHKENIDIKYIKEAEDDADIDPEWTISDAFIDHGKAEQDKSDQRATIKLIRKTVEGFPLRAGSVVPDLNLPQYQRPMPKRPPVPIPDFGPPNSVLGKRQSSVAFPGPHGYSYDDVRAGQTSRRPLAQITEADLPVSSIERDEEPATVEESSTRVDVAAHDDLRGDSVLRDRSRVEEDSHVPSTYADDHIQYGESSAMGRDMSRPHSPHRLDHDDADITGDHLLREDYFSKGDVATPPADKVHTLANGADRQSAIRVTPTSLPSTSAQPIFVGSESRLARQSRPPFNDWRAWKKSINDRQEKRKADTFDLPESDIEDSQQDPAPPTTKRPRISTEKSSSPARRRSSASTREINSLRGSNTQEGSKRVEQLSNKASRSRNEEANLTNVAEDPEDTITSVSRGPSTADEQASNEPSGISASNNLRKGLSTIASEGQRKHTDHVQPESDDVNMEDEVSTRRTSASASLGSSGSDKENAAPSVHEKVAVTMTQTDSQKEADGGNQNVLEDEDLNAQNPPDQIHDLSAENPMEASSGLNVLRQVEQAKGKQKASNEGQERPESPKTSSGEPEKSLGLGTGQSPGRRRRTSSFIGSAAPVMDTTGSVSNTRPIPKGKKAKASNLPKEHHQASTHSNDVQQQALEPMIIEAAMGGSGTTSNSKALVSESAANTPQPQNARKKTTGNVPSTQRSSPEMTRIKGGKVIPRGLTEEQYDQLVMQNRKKAQDTAKENSVDASDQPQDTSTAIIADSQHGKCDSTTKSKSSKATKKTSEQHSEEVGEPADKQPPAKKTKKTKSQPNQEPAEPGHAAASTIKRKRGRPKKVTIQEQADAKNRENAPTVSIPARSDTSVPVVVDEIPLGNAEKPDSVEASTTKPKPKKSKATKTTVNPPVPSFDSVSNPAVPEKKSVPSSSKPSTSSRSTKSPPRPAVIIDTTSNQEQPPSSADKKKATPAKHASNSVTNPPYKNPKPAAPSSKSSTPSTTSTKDSTNRAPTRPLITPRASLQSLKEAQEAARREREEKEKQKLRQQSTVSHLGKTSLLNRTANSKPSNPPPSFFNNDDDDDTSSSESDTSDSDSAPSNKINPPLPPPPSTSKAKPAPPTKAATAANSASSVSSAKPSASTAATPATDQPSAASSTSSSSSSSSSPSPPEQKNGSAIKPASTTTAKPTKPATTNTASTSSSASDTDDTDIVKLDRTPPASKKPTTVGAVKGGGGWGFSRLTGNMFGGRSQ